MGEVIATVDVLPPAIKAGWLIWMAWAAAQVVWYRRAHGVAARAAQPAVAAPVARRRPESRPDARPESRPDARSDSRPDSHVESHHASHPSSHVDARPASADALAPAATTLPAIDLSDISAFAERPSRASDSATPPASILGLDPRPSTN